MHLAVFLPTVAPLLGLGQVCKTFVSTCQKLTRQQSVMVPNYNSLSQSFSSQALVMLGLFNESDWEDGNGLRNGEVVSSTHLMEAHIVTSGLGYLGHPEWRLDATLAIR